MFYAEYEKNSLDEFCNQTKQRDDQEDYKQFHEPVENFTSDDLETLLLEEFAEHFDKHKQTSFRLDTKPRKPDSLFKTDPQLHLSHTTPDSTLFEARNSLRLSSLGRRWTEYEEVVLLGVVFECSLLSKKGTGWDCVTRCYREAIKNLNHVYKANFMMRTNCGLRKHWKNMQKRVQKHSLGFNYWHQICHKRWLSDSFNGSGKLLQMKTLFGESFKSVV